MGKSLPLIRSASAGDERPRRPPGGAETHLPFELAAMQAPSRVASSRHRPLPSFAGSAAKRIKHPSLYLRLNR
jgi:hypothetical protein